MTQRNEREPAELNEPSWAGSADQAKLNLSRRAMMQGALATASGLALSQSELLAAAVGRPAKAPFPYVQAKAFHIPPETNTEESGYFSLCEGRNGKIYIGTAAYGRNAYLVEFDPATEKMRTVLDVHKLVGQKTTGYAAQAKLHTRNSSAPRARFTSAPSRGTRRRRNARH